MEINKITCEWVPITDDRTKSIINSDKVVLVACHDYGYPYQFALARAWQSSIPGQPIKWYLDRNFYGLDINWCIAETVDYWLEIPPIPNYT